MPPVVRKIPVLRQARFSLLQLEKHRVEASPVRRKQALLQLSSCSEQESAIAWQASAIQMAPVAAKANAKPLRIRTSPPASGDHSTGVCPAARQNRAALSSGTSHPAALKHRRRLFSRKLPPRSVD
jgi:hypothetical protein